MGRQDRDPADGVTNEDRRSCITGKFVRNFQYFGFVILGMQPTAYQAQQ
jgi:hypothetical protein